MHVLTLYAHPNPNSFCHAILDQFTAGLKEAGHTTRVVDLYAIRFNPVSGIKDFAGFERVFSYGFVFALTPEGWRGEIKGRVPLLHHEKALIITPTLFRQED